MEPSTGQKRAREDDVANRDEEEEVVSESGKKLCVGLGVAGKVDVEDSAALTTTTTLALGEISKQADVNDDSDAALLETVLSSDEADGRSSEAWSETMKSLEEELGFSDDSADYTTTVSSAAVEDFTGPDLGTWGADIWNVQEFGGAEGSEVLLAGDVTGSSESSPAVSGSSPSSRNSSVAEEDTTGTKAVDIGFLCEASDDELGIPPSPLSERGQSSEQDVSGEQLGYGDDSVASLQEAVSWALDESDAAPADSGIEEWMTGNLDFMMENPSESFEGSALLEAGSML